MLHALRRVSNMPLRARIDPRMLPNLPANYSTLSVSPTSADAAADEVLFSNNGASRVVTLNRPKKLNAINQNMCELILPRLLEYAKSDLTGSIIVKGAGGKALSAGGDVTSLALRTRELGLEKAGPLNSEYFRIEFGLNHTIATYQKPYVSFWDGIVMGGGVGLTAHGSFRIATERTLLAMPETTIGYYPDVGGLFYLARLNGELGLFAALTSYRFKGYDAYHLGLASHYIASELVSQVEARLSELEANGIEQQEYYQLVNSAIEDFASEPPSSYKPAFTGVELDIIDEAFSKNTIEEIIESLQSLSSKSPKFVADTLKILNERSPLSLKVVLKAYRNAAKLDIASSFQEEMKVCQNFNLNPNFSEGVIALLVEKRAPKWQPATLAEVTNELVDSFFIAPPSLKPVTLENDRTFLHYPHQFGLPSERDIKNFVTGETSEQETKATRNDVLEHFSKKYPGGMKLGLTQYVDELLARKTTPDPEDSTLLDWNY